MTQFDAYMAGQQERDERSRQRLAAIHASGKTAMEWALERIERAGRQQAVATLKFRARQFIRRPAELNAVAWNLSQATAHDGLAIVERLIRQQPARATFPINVPVLNLRAARLVARWARRAERNGTMDALIYGRVA